MPTSGSSWGGTRSCECTANRVSKCSLVNFNRGLKTAHCQKWLETARPRVQLSGGNHIVVSVSRARKWANIAPAVSCLDRYGVEASKVIDTKDLPDLGKVGTYKVKYSCTNERGVESGVEVLTVDVQKAAFDPSRACPLTCALWHDGCNACYCVGGILQQCGKEVMHHSAQNGLQYVLSGKKQTCKT